jgi:ornithine carbamoyltransferase
MLGLNLCIATPKGYEPDNKLLKQALSYNRCVELMNDPFNAVEEADVVYTDVWVSMGDEEEEKKRLNDFKGFQVNKKLMSKAKKDAVFMHCLPAHRGLEVTDEVVDSSQSIVWQQAENRLHIQKAILLNELHRDS